MRIGIFAWTGLAALAIGPLSAFAESADPVALLADAGFEQNRHYVRLPAATAVPTRPGETEVTEFFMYGCIFCYRLEPRLDRWLETTPAEVTFVRAPIAWNPVLELHARAYYAARTLGRIDVLHSALFQELHITRNPLQSSEAVAELFARHSIGAPEFGRAFESFGVATELRRAEDLARRYGVDQTPTFVVNGKWRTTPSMAGSNDRLFELVDLLISIERR